MATYLNPKFDIRLEEVPDGILVSQEGRTYLARDWRLTSDVRQVLDQGIEHGLTCLWQTGHPGTDESHHISFSFSHAPASWVFVIGKEARPPALKRVTFQKRLKEYFKHAGLGWNWENAGGKNIYVNPLDLESILATLPLDDIRHGRLTTTTSGSRTARLQFFSRESELEDELYRMIRESAKNEVDVHRQRSFVSNDGFEVASRPDILVNDLNCLFVIELKLYEAGEADLGQIDRYLRNQAVGLAYVNKRLHGILVAERFDPTVVAVARTRNNLTLMRHRQESDGRLVLDPVAGPDVLRHFLGA